MVHLSAIRPSSSGQNVDKPVGRKRKTDESDDSTSASRKKIERMGTAENVESGDEQQHWILAHVFQLTRLLTDVSCPDCGETGLSVTVCDGEQHGFSAKLALRCDGCGYQKFEMSSPQIHDRDKKNVAYEINPEMVMFSHEVGGSHSVLTTFGTVIGMPTMHLKTYQGHDKKVTGMCVFMLICFNLPLSFFSSPQHADAYCYHLFSIFL